MNTHFKDVAIATGLIVAATVPAQISVANTTQPNIIMILVDDVGYGDFSCYGNENHNTPNIDRLANMGLKFTDFHSNGAVSSPTRCALMTGRYQQYSGIEGVITAKSHRDFGLPIGTETLATMMNANGYNCAIYGKWHLGYPVEHNPVQFGFDEFVGYISGNVDYFSHIDQEGFRDWWHNDVPVEEEGYTTYLVTEYAERYIARRREKPFFLYLPYETSHGPYQGPSDRAMRSIVDGEMVIAEDYGNDDNHTTYKEMIEALDECIGRVLDATERAGIAENTLILFCSDNGGAKFSCNAPLSGGKGGLREGGHRVSAMAYWPETIEGGKVSDETLMTFDIMPTIFEVCGISAKGMPMDGVSFLPTILKDKPIKERTLFWRHGDSVAARRGDWKLLIDRKKGTVSLFNLSDDIAEKHDIKDQNPKILASLTAEIAAWEAQFENITMGTN